jgi:hypothetical protein
MKTDEAKKSDEAPSEDEATPQDETKSEDEARSQDDSSGEDGEAPEDEATGPVDQSPALRNDGTLNLGVCHFGGAEEPASLLATRSDGTGWIAVCEKHTKDAEEQGFVIEESANKEATSEKSDGDKSKD